MRGARPPAGACSGRIRIPSRSRPSRALNDMTSCEPRAWSASQGLLSVSRTGSGSEAPFRNASGGWPGLPPTSAMERPSREQARRVKMARPGATTVRDPASPAPSSRSRLHTPSWTSSSRVALSRHEMARALHAAPGEISRGFPPVAGTIIRRPGSGSFRSAAEMNASFEPSGLHSIDPSLPTLFTRAAILPVAASTMTDLPRHVVVVDQRCERKRQPAPGGAPPELRRRARKVERCR